MGMPYSKAWLLLNTIEKRLGFAVLERKVGGYSGGGSQVTPRARVLKNHYERFCKDAKRLLRKFIANTSFSSIL